MRKFWTNLKHWQRVCAAIAVTIAAAGAVYQVVSTPILYFERTQNSIAGLSNRVDEISYKVDLLLGDKYRAATRKSRRDDAL